MDKQQEYVLRAIEERDISFIRLWFTDVSGQLKSVAIAPAEVESAFEEGIGFDGSAIEGLTRVFESDMLLAPDPSTFQMLPGDVSEPQADEADGALFNGSEHVLLLLVHGASSAWGAAVDRRRDRPAVRPPETFLPEPA